MKLQVNSHITHGTSDSHVLLIEPGIYDTEEKDSLITEELAEMLIETTNGSVVEYEVKPAAKVKLVEREKTQGEQTAEIVEAAQDAQTERFAQARKDRVAEKAEKAEKAAKKNS